ncbi:hypothetical protein [Chondrinema litorale]|uniref:hypothetical protein n=1 Tax=Chondrinema litorale TaxID=2994555 RepID=UPI0025428D6C|nr:hypothetical protein [Chondrinema litorale]UZR97031.1 hypothetical protein OQ292_23315 [Chondrinema litorale]
MKKSFFILLVVLFPVWSIAQQTQVPFSSDRWKFEEAEYQLENYKGQESILLKSGGLYLKDFEFLNGTIEVDINFPEHRAFHDVIFRIKDFSNYESFYVRPHQSGNPDANQYTPVFNGLAGWQLYYGDRYATPVNYTFDEWHKIKIVVLGTQTQIYFDDMEKPILHVEELKRGEESGSIGLFTFMGPVHYANFKYSQTTPTLLPDDVEIPILEETVVKNWMVSNVTNKETLGEGTVLHQSLTEKLTWNEYPVESEGILNLAKYTKISEIDNIVLASIDIYSETDQTKKVYFGYSDIAKVFFNGNAIYEGQRIFRSRDYRYLGTIGLFDGLYLPLKKGKNTLTFGILENMGGWGVKAQFENMEGISLTQ